MFPGLRHARYRVEKASSQNADKLRHKEPQGEPALHTENQKSGCLAGYKKTPGSNIPLSLCSSRICPTKVTLRLVPKVTVSGVERVWGL